MAYWTELKCTSKEPCINRRVSIAGRVTNNQTGHAIGGALVRISEGPPAFVQRLITLATIVTVADDALKEHYGTLADPGINAQKIAAASAILDDRRVQRLVNAKRTDKVYTSADGYFYFTDLPPGSGYKLQASLLDMGTRYASAESGPLTVTVDNSQLIELALPATTVKGRIYRIYREVSTDAAIMIPVAFAEVRARGSNEVTYSDSNGHYWLTGIEATTKVKRTIQIKAQGYVPLEVEVAVTGAGAEVIQDFAL